MSGMFSGVHTLFHLVVIPQGHQHQLLMLLLLKCHISCCCFSAVQRSQLLLALLFQGIFVSTYSVMGTAGSPIHDENVALLQLLRFPLLW